MPKKSDFKLSSIPEIIEEARQGRIFILVDDEDRENEGDLVIPAQMCDDQKINFMAKYGRGLICLALDEKRVKELDLPLMSLKNESRNKTAFTISIEAREGISTGVSAFDRAKTISDAINPSKSKSDLVSPGHIFPLQSAAGGVLVRAGHTEAAVDIAKLADLNPSGVICEIMNDDGTMARMQNLVEFANTHNLKIATIADLIEYRRQHEKLISLVKQDKFYSEFGEFDLKIYRSTIDDIEHIALCKGDQKNYKNEEVLVRMHHFNLFSDCLLNKNDPRSNNLQKSLSEISKSKHGVIVIIRQPNNLVENLLFKDTALNLKSNKPLRNYGIGAQILNDLGIKKMRLLTNSPKSVVGLDGYDIEIIGYKSI